MLTFLPRNVQFYSILFLFLVSLFPPSRFLHPPGTALINIVSAEKGGKQRSERVQPKWELFALSQHIRCIFLLTDVIQILNQKPGFSPPTTLYSLSFAKQTIVLGS